MVDSYQKVRKTDIAPENEVRVSSLRGNSEYISKAAELLLEKKLDEVIVRGLRGATINVITVVDVLRRKIKGLHLDWKLEILSTDEEYLPLHEGLDKKIINRRIPTLIAVLSFTAKDTKSPGYQAPLPDSKVTETPLELLKSGPKRTPYTRPPRTTEDNQETTQTDTEPRRQETGYRRPRGRFNRGGPRVPRGDFENRGTRGGYHNREARGGSYNREARGGYYNREPRVDSYNQEPRGESYSKEPRGESYNRAPRGESYNKEPRGESYNREPRGESYNREPRGESYNREPRGEFYNREPRGEHVGFEGRGRRGRGGRRGFTERRARGGSQFQTRA